MRYEKGVEFGGRYTLGDRIAVGGMGEVWRAHDQVLNRAVAIKLLSPTLAGQPGFAQRFREEARNSAALGHPNIANVYDYGETDGAHWLVMELVEGENLAQIIKNEHRLEPQQVRNIMAQAALALQAAHDGGVVHRDVKPANIIVRKDGVVKLTDFGISRAVDAVPITRTGEVMGTAQYISPEQATGQTVSPASDIYSLGVVAYELVAGHRPFDESTPVATAMAHVQDPVPPLPRWVPEDLATIILSCLNKDPNDRPASAGDLARMLNGGPAAADLLATQRITTPMASQTTTRRMNTRPHAAIEEHEDEYGEESKPKTWLWVIGGIAAIAALLWGAAALGLFDVSPPEPRPAPSTTQSTTTDDAISVVESEYVGRQVGTVTAELSALGLRPEVEEVDSEERTGTVVGIPNAGTLQRNDVVRVQVSRGMPATQEPAPQPTTQAPAPTETVTITQEPVPAPPPSPEQPAPTSEPAPQQPAPQPTQDEPAPEEPQTPDGAATGSVAKPGSTNNRTAPPELSDNGAQLGTAVRAGLSASLGLSGSGSDGTLERSAQNQ